MNVTFAFVEGRVNIYKLLRLGTSHIGQQRFKLPEWWEQQINYISHVGFECLFTGEHEWHGDEL